MEALCRGAGILKVNILWRDLHIVQSGLDIGMAHQLHERWQADTGTHHILGEGMSEPVWVGDLYAGGAAMMAKQGA